MRTHRGHFTTQPKFIAEVMKAAGKNEMKFRSDGLWRKVTKDGTVVTASSRDKVRQAARSVTA